MKRMALLLIPLILPLSAKVTTPSPQHVGLSISAGMMDVIAKKGATLAKKAYAKIHKKKP